MTPPTSPGIRLLLINRGDEIIFQPIYLCFYYFSMRQKLFHAELGP